MLADACRTLVDVYGTMLARILRGASALKGSAIRPYCTISTLPTVCTRVVCARLDFNLAIRAFVAILTFARVFCHTVNTMTVITADTCFTVVDIVVAVHPVITKGAVARVRTWAGMGASSVIAQVRVLLALVDAFPAVFTRPSVLAVARVLLVVGCRVLLAVAVQAVR